MSQWRRRAMREVRDELDRFLNYPLNQKIALGDFGTYDGKHCRFEWEGNITQLGLKPQSAGFQHEIAETYATAGKVSIQGRLNVAGDRPAVDVTFSRASALAFRGFKIGFDQAQLVGLSETFSDAIAKGMVWDRHKVIVTQLWRASGFTHLVAGGHNARVQIEATAANVPQDFNFADPSLGLSLSAEQSMSYCAVGQSDVNPYFGVHKLRERVPGQWSLYKYGVPTSH